MNYSVEEKISRAKTIVLRKSPFFAILLLETPVEIVEWMDTMATDGKTIYANKKFIEKYSEEKLAGVMVHEVLHKAWLHVYRVNGRDPKLWNVACDYAINQTVLDLGFQLPEEGIFDKAGKYKNMSANEIYDLLLKDVRQMSVKFPSKGGNGKPDQGDGDGKNEMWGGMLEVTDGNGNPVSDAEREELIEEAKISLDRAVQQAKSRGTIPAGLEGLIKASEQPKIDWKQYIQSFIKGAKPDNVTWRRPNRKMMAVHEIYMPVIQTVGAGIGVLSIDTSGSVSDRELIRYISEILGMIEMTSPDKLIIIQHDAIIQKVDVWEFTNEFSGLAVKGRGGTCIQPTFNYIKTIDDQVDWMICFTDMGICDWPTADQAPAYPVLWAATGPDSAPFGQYVDLRGTL